MAMPSTASTSRSSARTPFQGCSSGFLQGLRRIAAQKGVAAKRRDVRIGGCKAAACMHTKLSRPSLGTCNILRAAAKCCYTCSHASPASTHCLSCRYCRHLMEACPAAAEASPTPSSPPMGPAMGVAHDTRRAMPAAWSEVESGKWFRHESSKAGRLPHGAICETCLPCVLPCMLHESTRRKPSLPLHLSRCCG